MCPPVGSPLKLKLMSMYLPKRLELSLRFVLAFPKASSTQLDFSSTFFTLIDHVVVTNDGFTESAMREVKRSQRNRRMTSYLWQHHIKIKLMNLMIMWGLTSRPLPSGLGLWLLQCTAWCIYWLLFFRPHFHLQHKKCFTTFLSMEVNIISEYLHDVKKWHLTDKRMYLSSMPSNEWGYRHLVNAVIITI